MTPSPAFWCVYQFRHTPIGRYLPACPYLPNLLSSCKYSQCSGLVATLARVYSPTDTFGPFVCSYTNSYRLSFPGTTARFSKLSTPPLHSKYFVVLAGDEFPACRALTPIANTAFSVYSYCASSLRIQHNKILTSVYTNKPIHAIYYRPYPVRPATTFFLPGKLLRIYHQARQCCMYCL